MRVLNCQLSVNLYAISRLSANTSAISQLSVNYDGSWSSFISHAFLRFVSYQRWPSHKPNNVEYYPKVSEEPSTASSPFRGFTSTVYHFARILRLLETTCDELRAVFVLSNVLSRH